MATLKQIDDADGALQALVIIMDGIVTETMPRKLVKPWEKLEANSKALRAHLAELIKKLEKSKAKLSKDEEKELDGLVRKWNDGNNVYGGILAMQGECKEAQASCERVEKAMNAL